MPHHLLSRVLNIAGTLTWLTACGRAVTGIGDADAVIDAAQADCTACLAAHTKAKVPGVASAVVVSVEEHRRGQRALELFKEVYKTKTETNSVGFAWHDVWRRVRELLAEDMPGRVLPGEVER